MHPAQNQHMASGPDNGPPNARNGSHPWIEPSVIGYVISPCALLLVLFLQHFNLIASHPLGIWVALILAIMVANFVVDRAYHRYESGAWCQLRLATHSGTITAAIYMTGWGPVLIAAYALGTLETFSLDGSRIWKSALGWSLVGIGVGQILIGAGMLPSFLSARDSLAVGIMCTFVLCFIVRIAAAIVEQKEVAEESLRRSEQRFRALVQNSTDTTFVVAADGSVTYASPATQALFDLAPETFLGKQVMSFVHPDDVDRAETQLLAELEVSTITRQIEVKMVGSNGLIRDVEAVVTDQLTEPAVEGWVVNMRDITDRKAAEALLLHQANHDGLTGLPNRGTVLDYADRMLGRRSRAGKKLAIFYLDVDNFKDVNDSFGHETGDAVLEVVGRRLAAILRRGEVVGRMGGDEFVVLAEFAESEEAVAAVARRLREAMATPVRLGGEDGPLLQLTLSIGVARGAPESANELLREADIALYQAKLAGRDAWVAFVPEMRSTAFYRLELQSELTSALAEQQYTLLFQPIIDLHEGGISAAEALLRWEHPVHGTVLPDQFIPLLEQSGHIVEVGRWVIDEACRHCALWWADGHEIAVTVNASVRQLEDSGFVDSVLSAVTRHGLTPSAVVIEIMESGLIGATATVKQNLSLLKQSGVRVAIDDFGTGSSSLAYLLQFDVDALKIDRSFIAATGTSNHAMAVVRAVIQLSKTLDLQVVAEGIEDSEQLALLRAEGCGWGQGTLFSRPVPPASLAIMLMRARDQRVPSHSPLIASDLLTS